jgi:hypothetical protein
MFPPCATLDCSPQASCILAQSHVDDAFQRTCFCCLQFWYWGPMAAANRTMAASPVFKLPNSFPVIHREYSWRDFVAQRMTNLQDDKVRGRTRIIWLCVSMCCVLVLAACPPVCLRVGRRPTVVLLLAACFEPYTMYVVQQQNLHASC